MKKIILTALLSVCVGNAIADENSDVASAAAGVQQASTASNSNWDPTQNVYFNKADIRYVKLINMIGTIPLKVRLDDVADPDTITFAMGDEFIFDWDNGQARFEYTGAGIQMLDLNDGGKSDDLFPDESNGNDFLKYEYGGERQAIVVDMTSGSVSTVNDTDGISGHKNSRLRGYYDPAVTGQDTIFIYLEPM